jgi:small subunit ribosomal protein S20
MNEEKSCMPHLKSAKKRLRQSRERNARNRATVKELRTQIKKVLRACKDKNPTEAQSQLKLACRLIDKCALRGYIAKNAGARYKSRLTIRVNRSSGPVATGS